jgi:TonB family protein
LNSEFSAVQQHRINVHEERKSVSSRSLALLLIVSLAFVLTATPQEIRVVSESAAKHAAIEKPAPMVSQLAREMKVSGKVEVGVSITQQGCVQKVKVLSGNALLAEGVVIAVRRWTFHPFLEAGAAVAVSTTLSFEFKQ